MTYDYSSFESLAVRMISDKGRNVTYRQINAGVYDTSTGSLSLDGFTDTTVKVVETKNKTRLIDNTLTQRADKTYLMDASVITPNKKDRVVDNSKEYQIINIEEVKPGDSVIYYKIEVKK